MPKKIDYASMFTLRSDGRYMGYWHDLVGGQPTGKRHPIYDRDPEKLYEKIKAKEQPAEPTFADIAEAWRDTVWETYKEGTRASYAAMYKRALDEQDGRLAAEVTPSDISNHLQRLAAQKLSARSVKALRTVYRQIYQQAIIDEHFGQYVKSNPAVNVPLPRNAAPAVQREAPDDEIIDAIRANATTAYFGLFAMFLISTGFRRGEALAVTWGDIDFKAKTISCSKQVVFRNTAHIDDVKTKSGVRTVPLLPDLAKVLKRPKKAKDTEYVFPAEDGSFFSQASFERHWNHYCKDQGFKVCVLEEPRVSLQKHKYIHREYKNTLTPHVLRHGYATMLYDAGVDAFTAQKLLGHAHIETTLAVYTHLSQRKKDESIQKLDAYVKNGYRSKQSKPKKPAKKEDIA